MSLVIFLSSTSFDYLQLYSHNFIYQKFIRNTSFSFTTFSLQKVKLILLETFCDVYLKQIKQEHNKIDTNYTFLFSDE